MNEHEQENATEMTDSECGADVPVPARTWHRWGSIASAAFVGGLGVVLACYLWIKLYRVVSLFLIGYLLAYALDPVIRLLQRRLQWSRVKAVWLVMGCLVLVLVLSGWAIVPPLVNQALGVAENWDRYIVEVNHLYLDVTTAVTRWLGDRFPQAAEWSGADARMAEAERWAGERVPDLLRWLSSQLLASVGVLGLGILLLVISFHFMLLSETVRETARRFIPSEHTDDVEQVGSQIDSMLGQYLRGVIVLFFANGIGATVIMYVLSMFYGNQYALIVGLLTGVTNMVPYVGPIVSAGSAGLLTYVTATSNELAATVLAVVLMFVMSQYFGIIVQPRLIGRRINLDPLAVLFAMFAGYQLFGLVGVIIGIPIAACVKIVLARWIPVIGPPPSVRAPGEPLLLDLGQAARDLWSYAQRAYGRGQGLDATAPSPGSAADRTSPDARDEPDAPADDGASDDIQETDIVREE